MVASLECARIAALGGGVEVHPFEEYGHDELIFGGADRSQASLEVMSRACRSLGLRHAAVPAEFPIELADRLRGDGIELAVDRGLFETRRRVKSSSELAGIRRAQAAAEAGMWAAVELLRQARPNGQGLVSGGEPLTCERVKAAIREAVDRAGASPGETMIVSHGAQTASGHDAGSGPIRAGEPVVIDLWPQDFASACYADMTRTFVVGEVPAELRRYHELTRESLARALAAVRPGAAGRDVHRISCEPYEEAGLPTQLSKTPATSSRSNPAATGRASAGAGWRISSW